MLVKIAVLAAVRFKGKPDWESSDRLPAQVRYFRFGAVQKRRT
jgi:hypothetical protein